MSVKKELRKLLEENRGMYISGEEIAGKLKVSRTAIWKAIRQLKEEGHNIVAIQNKGYCLSESDDIITEEGIRIYLSEGWNDIPIDVIKETTSTNQISKIAASNGATDGSVFLAEKQTNGRGRLGRSFLSIDGSGIYMSILLRPNVLVAAAVPITTAASVAVWRAIKKVTGKETGIKWVNDIYYEGKKICGILTEAVTNVENGMVDSIIIGIGINFNMKTEDIPEELKDIAGALYHGDSLNVTRNQLIAEVINQVFELCKNTEKSDYLTEYKEHSLVLNRDIYILSGDEKTEAKAIDINETGGLVVQLKDGSIQNLNSGEVSIRWNRL